MRLPSHTCRLFTKDGTVKHVPTYKRPRRGVLIAVQHRSAWTMSPSVSTKIFSLVLLLAASATASPVEERGFFRWALLTGSWLSLNPVFWFRPQCLCVFVIFLHVFLRLLTILPKSVFRSGFSASPLAKPPALPPPPAAPLEDSSGRRQDLLTNSHRIISHKLSSRMSPIQSQENNVDLRSDLPRSLSQLLRPLSPTQRRTSGERILQVGWLFKIGSISHFSFDCLSSADCFELSNMKNLQRQNFGKIGVLNILMEIQISPFAGLPAMAPALLLASHPQPAALSEDSSGGKLSEFAEIPKLISRRRTTLTCAQIFPVLAANQGWTSCS